MLDKRRSAIIAIRGCRSRLVQATPQVPEADQKSTSGSKAAWSQHNFHLVSTRTIIAGRLVAVFPRLFSLIETSCPLAAAHPASRRRPQRSRKSSTPPQTIRDTHTITLCMTLTASLRRRNLRPRLQAIKQAIPLRRRRATSRPICTSIQEAALPATPTLS